MLELIAALALCAERVGAAAEILETHTVVLKIHEREKFPMQSVYKLPIGMAVVAAKLPLDRVVHVDTAEYISKAQHSPLRDSNPKGADVSVRELLRLAVSESDGTASDVLMRLLGGPSAVMKYLDSIGVKEMIVRDPEMELGKDWWVQYQNWATPAGTLVLLRALQDWQPQELMTMLLESKSFPTRIKGMLPPGTPVAHKTGSSGKRNGVAAATNDIGIVTLPSGKHLAIAVYVCDSTADDKARDATIAKIARQAWDSAVKE
jgi:beta-lactamase class A